MPSVTRTTNRTRARRGAAEQQVLTAVEELLAEGEAFTTLGVARIAERAGIARSSFYVHFPDKTELLMRLTASATDKLFEVAEAWVVNDEATYADLQTTAQAVLSEYRRHGALLTAFAEVATYDPVVAGFWRTRIRGFADVLRKRIVRAQKAGLVGKDIDAAVTAEFIAWGTERTVAQRVITDPEGRDDAALADGIARSIWTLVTGSAPAQ